MKIFTNHPTASGWKTILCGLLASCLGVGTFLCIASSADGQDVPATAVADPTGAAPPVKLSDVRRVLRDLDAGELQVRDAAERKLVAMGRGVLPYLPAVTARTPGELKVRLQRIRQALQQDEIEVFFEPSLVTLHGKFRLAEAIEQISKQTGNPIKLQSAEGLAGVEVELDAEDAEFWSVMGELMSQAKLRVNAYGTTEGELVLSAGMPDATSAPPIYVNGPFRLDVVSVQTSLPFYAAIGGQLDLSFNLTWEPRLKPVFMQLPMASVQATLSGGKTLAASSPQAAPEIPLNLGGCSTQIDLQVQRPDRSETTIDRLTGEFVIAVPSERHKYVFEKFGNGARQSEKYGDVSVTLEGARRNGAVYEMRVFVEFGDSQGALDSFRGWILSNECYLYDAKDVRLENVGYQTYAMAPNAVGIAYLFQINGNPDDYKLVYESPGAITKQRVQYELTGIPLP